MIELELLTDTDQHFFVKFGIRGGTAILPNHQATANIRWHRLKYAASWPISLSLYTNCNNLYGADTSCLLSYADLQCPEQIQLESLEATIVYDEWRFRFGYILELDSHYSEGLYNIPRNAFRISSCSSTSSRYAWHVFFLPDDCATQSADRHATLSITMLKISFYKKQNDVLHIKNFKLCMSSA